MSWSGDKKKNVPMSYRDMDQGNIHLNERYKDGMGKRQGSQKNICVVHTAAS